MSQALAVTNCMLITNFVRTREGVSLSRSLSFFVYPFAADIEKVLFVSTKKKTRGRKQDWTPHLYYPRI